MKKITFPHITKLLLVLMVMGIVGYLSTLSSDTTASSHREAPLIAFDPLADNTDLYAFRSPDNPEMITILANYIPLQLPHGGPNYASFGENIRYEIHIKNNPATPGDDITYRFTFTKVNEDPTTFFNIRLGAENLKTSYVCERSLGGGPFQVIVQSGVVPPPNVGPRSITTPVGLDAPSYESLMMSAITQATGTGGEMIYAGPADDPFFVDLGGAFDLGHFRTMDGTGADKAADGVACKNVHVIALQIPISFLQKDGLTGAEADDILDSDFIIGVWASASRPQMRTLGAGTVTDGGDWVQVSRLGMPLTNEVIIPIGEKDHWNAYTPYDATEADYEQFFTNPELGLYMDDALFGTAVPELGALRIQRASQTVLGNVDFGNTNDGLFILAGNAALAGTALDAALFGNYLLRDNQPRSADILPIFYTGVPNLPPYQLATGKPDGNPLAPGKPFINNFLPTFGDMLRLNMAVPPTQRNDPAFSSEGLLAAAVAGLLDPAYNTTTDLQLIPNMDGFPNGRRLEDDVTRIELQAVGGVVLAAIGLWYDDRNIGESPVSQDLLDVLGFTAGVEANDVPLDAAFPYVQEPWSGVSGDCSGELAQQQMNPVPINLLTFTGTVETKANLLQWATASELNNDFFTLQRSTDDGATFVKVTTVDAAGTSTNAKSYSYRDQKIQNGTVYYRLLQTDFNGQTKQVGQVALSRTATNLMIANVSPSPARDNLKVEFTTTANQKVTVRLYDVFGRTMNQQEVAATSAGTQTLNVDVSSYAKGTYFVLLTNGKESKVQKFVKQ